MINLGDEVKDEVSGFQGVVMARMELLYEATSCRVHPRNCHDGKPSEGVWLEEARLKPAVQSGHRVVGFLSVKGKP